MTIPPLSAFGPFKIFLVAFAPNSAEKNRDGQKAKTSTKKYVLGHTAETKKIRADNTRRGKTAQRFLATVIYLPF